jgi:UDP-glucuronate 4-epimerase
LRFLVTGAAGFIGFHTAMRLCRSGHQVVGVDNLNDYYSVDLKRARLEELLHGAPGFEFHKLDIADRQGMQALFDRQRFDRVIHLAAQAGVRYSLENPHVYVDANLGGFINVLEGCRQTKVGHLVYASSSSVYGMNAKVPFAIGDTVDDPISLYAATKRANELMAHSYAHLYRIPLTGLRFFTVYGPWGRPDMAPFKFTKAVLERRPIEIYNHGDMSRDFTYIDDVVEGIVRVQACPPPYADEPEQRRQGPTDRLFNIGLGSPVRLLEFVECIESATGMAAIRQLRPMQPGDVPQTWAEVSALAERTGFRPTTSLREGVGRFVDWYRGFYGI